MAYAKLSMGQKLPLSKPTPIPYWSVVFTNCFISPADRLGFIPHKTEIAPETIGAAIDVPDFFSYPLFDTVLKTSSPGAQISTLFP